MTRRLLFVVNTPEFFVSHRLPVAVAARERGWDVHLAAPVGSDDVGAEGPDRGPTGSGGGDGRVPLRRAALDRLEREGVPVHPVDFHRRGFHPVRDPVTVGELRRLYRRLRPDVVHHVTYKPIALGGIAARLAGVPAVVHAVPGFGHLATVEGWTGRLRRRLMRAGYRLALGHDRMAAVFQNEHDRGLFLRLDLLDEDEAVLIPGSGVDLDRFRPASEPGGPPVVLFASRLLWTKGAGDFVEAARRLQADGVEARFLLAGRTDPGNPASVPAETVERWHREGPVEWLGHRDDMEEVMAASHVVCLPSRYGEGVPKVLLEGAAAGRPLVTTGTPGCRWAVRDGENGLLVSPGDPEALAAALRRLIEAPDLRRRMGEAGRRRAEADFAVEDVVRRHLELYRRLAPSG